MDRQEFAHTQAPADLPVPEAAALEHSNALRARIVAAIDAAGGSMPFSQFMQMALYEPGLGYYSAGSAKFGPDGDFVTAPDLGDFLAAAVARTLAPGLRTIADATVVELGAGNGALARDLLRRFAALGLSDVRYRILEVSPDLRERQQQALQEFKGRIEWVDTLQPNSVRGAVIANEVADAFPVERIVRIDGRWRLQHVAREADAFRWVAAPSDAVPAWPEHLSQLDLPDGYATEFCPTVGAWTASIVAALECGNALLIDYGMPQREYYHPQRSAGTLMCHYRHRAHADPFVYPGLQDITAWVDFSQCANAAELAGAQVLGYTTQGGWIAHSLQNADMARLSPAAAAQLKTLLLPGEMGERFKVMLLGKGSAAPVSLPGRDLRQRL